MLSLTTTVHIYCPRLGEAPRIEEERSRVRREAYTTLGNGSSSALPARALPLASVAAASRVGWACKSRSVRFGPVLAESVRGSQTLNLGVIVLIVMR